MPEQDIRNIAAAHASRDTVDGLTLSILSVGRLTGHADALKLYKQHLVVVIADLVRNSTDDIDRRTTDYIREFDTIQAAMSRHGLRVETRDDIEAMFRGLAAAENRERSSRIGYGMPEAMPVSSRKELSPRQELIRKLMEGK